MSSCKCNQPKKLKKAPCGCSGKKEKCHGEEKEHTCKK